MDIGPQTVGQEELESVVYFRGLRVCLRSNLDLRIRSKLQMSGWSICGRPGCTSAGGEELQHCKQARSGLASLLRSVGAFFLMSVGA